jgi:UPF0716 protein FxsA
VLGRLFLLFALVPILEIALLLEVGRRIGVFPTVLLVVVTAAAGAWLARREGSRTWVAMRREMRSGRMPASGLFQGAAIFAGALLLLTPGLLTDLVGFALLIPVTRTAILRRMRRRLEGAVKRGSVRYEVRSWSPLDEDPEPPQGRIGRGPDGR